MRIGRGELGARTLLSFAAALAALAVWSCSIEAPSPPLTSPPGLGALAPGDGGCLEPPSFCLGLQPDQCCRNTDECKFTACAQDSQVCINDVCRNRSPPCESSSDCVGDGGASAGHYVCEDGSCVPTTCSADGGCGPGQQCVSGVCRCISNRGCDAGHVCQIGDGDAGLCIPTLEEDPAPGCSASAGGGSRGALLTLLSVLALAGARRRRVARRSPPDT